MIQSIGQRKMTDQTIRAIRTGEITDLDDLVKRHWDLPPHKITESCTYYEVSIDSIKAQIDDLESISDKEYEQRIWDEYRDRCKSVVEKSADVIRGHVRLSEMLTKLSDWDCPPDLLRERGSISGDILRELRRNYTPCYPDVPNPSSVTDDKYNKTRNLYASLNNSIGHLKRLRVEEAEQTRRSAEILASLPGGSDDS
jgi:hypothetical protein